MTSDDEDSLWQQVTETVQPIKRDQVPPDRLISSKKIKKQNQQTDRTIPSGHPRDTSKATDLDRSTDDRLRRGKMTIEARVDLHGMTRDKAHDRLNDFILSSYEAGLRCVLVITGKGQGILRSYVPEWLTLPPLAGKILRCYPAQPHHGGDGAFYVLLRRRRDRPKDFSRGA